MANEADHRGCHKAIRHKLEKKEADALAKTLSMDFGIVANAISQGSLGWMLVVPIDRMAEVELILSGAIPAPAAPMETTSPEPSVNRPEPSVAPPAPRQPPVKRYRRDSDKKRFLIALLYFMTCYFIIKVDPDSGFFAWLCIGMGLWHWAEGSLIYNRNKGE